MSPASTKLAPISAYALAIHAVPSPTIVADATGRIVVINRHAEMLFGYGPGELVGASIEQLVPDRFRGSHPAWRKAFFAAPSARAMGTGRELFGVRKDGKEIPLEIGLNPIQTDDGAYVLGSIVDLTAHRRADEQFRLAVEAAPNSMLMVDASGRIVLANSQAERLFGYERSELIGMSVDSLVPARFRAAHPGFREAFFGSPDARPMGGGRDLRALRKDGTEVAVEIGLNPIETDHGVFVLGAIVDITERKRAEAEREKLLAREQAALAEARMANQAKDEFLSVLSHELRTPLNAILGWSGILRAQDVGPEELEHGLDVIERNSRRQMRIVGDILDVSRIIQGRFPLEIGACDLVTLIESVLATVRPAAQAKQILLRSVLDRIDPILLDAGRVEQIVWNLLSNAIKFSPKGARVEIRLAHCVSHVRLDVSDDGPGISPEFLPRVFDRFSQVDSSSTREHGGLGLGLAIARSLCELHGGWISVESDGAGHGATFIVRLPIVPADAADLASKAETPRPCRGGKPLLLNHLRVLVVDDEADTLEFLKRGLTRLGALVLTADGMSQALEGIETFHPDVLVSDIAMPGGDGYMLLQRARERCPGLPALALTAYAGAEHRRALLAAGFQLHVAKPVEIADLARDIADLATHSPQEPGTGDGAYS